MTAQTATTVSAGLSMEEANALVSEHIVIVKMEEESGYMLRSAPMPSSEASAYIARHSALGYSFDEEDCAMSCPCTELRFPEWFVGK